MGRALGFVVAVALSFAAVRVEAQIDPPPPAAQPAETAPAAKPPAPDVPTPGEAPRDLAPLGTRPPGTPPPGQPPSAPGAGLPTLNPEPTPPLPPLGLERQSIPPAPPPQPFYKKPWFWATVGVVAVTTIVIVTAAVASDGPAMPTTTLGTMHAF